MVHYGHELELEVSHFLNPIQWFMAVLGMNYSALTFLPVSLRVRDVQLWQYMIPSLSCWAALFYFIISPRKSIVCTFARGISSLYLPELRLATINLDVHGNRKPGRISKEFENVNTFESLTNYRQQS